MPGPWPGHKRSMWPGPQLGLVSGAFSSSPAVKERHVPRPLQQCHYSEAQSIGFAYAQRLSQSPCLFFTLSLLRPCSDFRWGKRDARTVSIAYHGIMVSCVGGTHCHTVTHSVTVCASYTVCHTPRQVHHSRRRNLSAMHILIRCRVNACTSA